jgi:hypothetical protein
VTLLAVASRVFALEEIPPGLCYDESFDGLDMLGDLIGHWLVYFLANRGRIPWFICFISATGGRHWLLMNRVHQ